MLDIRLEIGRIDYAALLGSPLVADGVEQQFYIDAGFEYDAITRLIVTKDMSERKAKMIELGDAFIAFSGGTGTLEEIAEAMSKVSLRRPVELAYYEAFETKHDAMSREVQIKRLTRQEKLALMGAAQEGRPSPRLARDTQK